MAEQAWRPRPCAYAHRRSGSPRVPVRSYYEGLPLMAGRGSDEGEAKATPDQRGVLLPCPDPEDGPGVEDATVERREAACLAKARGRLLRGARPRRSADRRSAPSRM